MKFNKKKSNNITFDIAIVGAGSTGIAFAAGFANTSVKVAIIDKLPNDLIVNPKKDGREIAITHHSEKILKDLKVWDLIPKRLISVIKEAKVLDGDMSYFLNFNHQEIKKKNLGYLIPNHVIRKSLYKRLKKINNITLINKAECLSVKIKEDHASINLSNGKIIKSSLIVAADGRFSKMRSKMGISAFVRDFKKDMIVCRMKHEKPHKGAAYEFFRYNQTQALLPYIKNQSSIVTTTNKDFSSTFMKMKKKDFNKEMENSFKRSFGKMKLVGKRYSYPMVTTFTKKFISERFAVIGDAAVGMHPVTAHGFNLGLSGIEILIKEIKFSIKNKNDIGSSSVLKNYQSKLRRIATPVYLTTNSIVNLYTSNILPAKITRQFMLRLVNSVDPIKQSFLNILK
jgi:ubiquinone biosynthesis UbiH/UbiF/VisC/COQ6 family hydroxylase